MDDVGAFNAFSKHFFTISSGISSLLYTLTLLLVSKTFWNSLESIFGRGGELSFKFLLLEFLSSLRELYSLSGLGKSRLKKAIASQISITSVLLTLYGSYFLLSEINNKDFSCDSILL